MIISNLQQSSGGNIMIEHLDGIHETVTYKENSSLRLFVNTDCEDYPIHWHTPMEIIMPLEGTYTVFLGDKPVLLQEGDIIFICPGILHSLVAPENGKRIILQIEWSVVSKIRDLNSILALISPVLTLTPQTAPDIYSDIYHLICQILSEYEEDSFLSEAVIYARMLDILSLLKPIRLCETQHIGLILRVGIIGNGACTANGEGIAIDLIPNRSAGCYIGFVLVVIFYAVLLRRNGNSRCSCRPAIT